VAHSFTSALFHCVFSTKDRRPIIDDVLQERLFPYMGGIAREIRARALTIGGVGDHVHLLLSLPSNMDVAQAMRLIKTNSSKWVHDTFSDRADFRWQTGYGAFSIGISQVDDTRAYIESQREHHRNRSFQEEFIAFLKRHEIEYDERYIWE
jgi:REP element-mobilizing transposase RayT